MSRVGLDIEEELKQSLDFKKRKILDIENGGRLKDSRNFPPSYGGQSRSYYH